MFDRLRRRNRDDARLAGTDASTDGRSDAPGWDAIDEALRPLYAGLLPQHVGYQPPAATSINLQGCSAYPAPGHWHYITYGLSELYTPHSYDDPEISGWGFELTIRVPRADEEVAPDWPFTMLNELAKLVRSDNLVLRSGDRIDVGRPVTGYPNTIDGRDSGLTVFALTVDPELGRIATPNGSVAFLQAVGVTAEEKQRMLDSDTSTVLASLAVDNPLLVTDPLRVGPQPLAMEA